MEFEVYYSDLSNTQLGFEKKEGGEQLVNLDGYTKVAYGQSPAIAMNVDIYWSEWNADKRVIVRAGQDMGSLKSKITDKIGAYLSLKTASIDKPLSSNFCNEFAVKIVAEIEKNGVAIVKRDSIMMISRSSLLIS